MHEPKMQWIDIGLNLTNSRFDKDRVQVIETAVAHGVTKMVVTGTNVEQSHNAVALAQRYPQHLFATAGCHPHDAKSLDKQGIAQIEQLAQVESVVAIGECGLDFNRDFSPRDVQIKVFKQQLELAVELNKPVFLHERDAFDTQFQILKDYMPQLTNAVSHCFTGSAEHLQSYLDLGLSIGITGWICDERRGQDLYQNVKIIPDDRLMLETDAPYLTPRNLNLKKLQPKPKSSKNLPQYLPHIGQTVSEARGQSLQHISNISYINSCRFFNLVE
jgi:TatD DNase family protein